MKPGAVSPSYIDRLVEERRYDGLVWLGSALCGTAAFKPSEADYGLARPLFLLVESNLWFAQSIRSGAWTYYEATPLERRKAMNLALQAEAPEGFAQRYAAGMANWKDEAEMRRLDAWLEAADDRNNAWLWTVVVQNRSLIDALFA